MTTETKVNLRGDRIGTTPTCGYCHMPMIGDDDAHLDEFGSPQRCTPARRLRSLVDDAAKAEVVTFAPVDHDDATLANWPGTFPTPEQLAIEEKRIAIVTEILAHDPSIGFVTALIMAGDKLSAQRAEELIVSGTLKAEKAISFVGSYARLDFAVRMHEKGKIAAIWLFKHLPELWRASDPDDTDPRFLELWEDARGYKCKIILDNSASHLPRSRRITVYRGQDLGAPLGIAWTTDRAIAERYARGMALRQGSRNGVVLTGTVARRDVLAYLTKRSESEVIVDPSHVTMVTR